MPDQEHEYAYQEDQLAFLLEDHPEVEHDIRDAPDDESRNDQVRDMISRVAHEAYDHEAKRCQAFQDHCLHVLFFCFLDEEYARQNSA